MSYCAKCGALLEDGKLECSKCGAVLVQQEEEKNWDSITEAFVDTTKMAAKGFTTMLESGVHFATDVVIPAVVQGTKDIKEVISKEDEKK